jgi:hypothetical protein
MEEGEGSGFAVGVALADGSMTLFSSLKVKNKVFTPCLGCYNFSNVYGSIRTIIINRTIIKECNFHNSILYFL